MKFVLFLLKYCFKKKWIVILSGIFILLMCELYNRFPFILQRLEYQVDEELVSVLRPNQVGFQWQGNMSYKSPLITINNDGNRGENINWCKPVILAAGNSEAIGSGVEDNEVWTYRLQEYLRNELGLKDFQVANASHPGFGPYHHYIRIKRILEKHAVEAIIIRVDLADRYFKYLPHVKVRKEIEKSKLRQKLRFYTKGIPYLLNKAKAQLPSIKSTFKPKFLTKKREQSPYTEKEGRQMLKENFIFWEKIAALANKSNTPLVFMVYDISNSDGCAIIIQELQTLLSESNNIYILQLKPENFGLNAKNYVQLRRQIRTTLTLKRDPHANPLQHRLIAKAAFEFFKKIDLLNNQTSNK